MNPRSGSRLGLTVLASFAAVTSLAQAPSQSVSPAPTQQAVASASLAAAKTSDDVRITSGTNGLELRIGQETPLNRVVSAVCKQQQITCIGTDSLAAFHVPKMSLGGTLREVVSKLLEGTDVNYSYSNDREGAAKEISFSGKAPRGISDVPASAVNVDEASTQPVSSVQQQQTVQEMFGGGVGSAAQQGQLQPAADGTGPIPGDTAAPTGSALPGPGNPSPIGQSAKPGSPVPGSEPIDQSPKPGLPFPGSGPIDQSPKPGSPVPPASSSAAKPSTPH